MENTIKMLSAMQMATSIHVKAFDDKMLANDWAKDWCNGGNLIRDVD